MGPKSGCSSEGMLECLGRGLFCALKEPSEAHRVSHLQTHHPHSWSTSLDMDLLFLLEMPFLLLSVSSLPILQSAAQIMPLSQHFPCLLAETGRRSYSELVRGQVLTSHVPGVSSMGLSYFIFKMGSCSGGLLGLFQL